MLNQSTSGFIDYSHTVDIDSVTKDHWTRILEQFCDTTIYQTWAYGATRMGEQNISHLLLKNNGNVVAACQSWIFRIPILNIGIAYIKWGPLWRLKGQRAQVNNLRLMVRLLKQEYVENRKLILRIMPVQVDEDAKLANSVYEEEDFRCRGLEHAYRTILADLTPPLEDVRKALNLQWRRNLKRAEKNKLTIITGVGDDLFEVFINLYREMRQRKNFFDSMNVNALREVQRELHYSQKMRILVCKQDGVPVAAIIVSALGSTAIYLHGATGNKGLDSRGSYLLHWQIIMGLQQIGCCWYELNGIDPQKNPGGYQFKSGLSGKRGKELIFLEFEIYPNQINKITVRLAEQIRSKYRRAREAGTRLLCAILIKYQSP